MNYSDASTPVKTIALNSGSTFALNCKPTDAGSMKCLLLNSVSK
jgi:hypothetical protein